MVKLQDIRDPLAKFYNDRIATLETENADLKKIHLEYIERNKWMTGKLIRLEDELSELREAAANYIKATDNLKHYRSLWAFEEITHDKLALAEQGQKVAESNLRELLKTGQRENL